MPSQTPRQTAPQETLDQIPRGTRVRVVGIDSPNASPDPSGSRGAAGPDAIARRLDDLGIRLGVELEVIRRAPLGDPTVFELHGYQLCLRRTESSRVRVEASAAPERRP